MDKENSQKNMNPDEIKNRTEEMRKLWMRQEIDKSMEPKVQPKQKEPYMKEHSGMKVLFIAVLCVALVSMTFFVGRWSTGASIFDFDSGNSSLTDADEKAEETDSALKENSTLLDGSEAGTAAGNEVSQNTTIPAEGMGNNTNISGNNSTEANQEDIAEEEPEEVPVKKERVITDYLSKKATFTVDKTYTDWKESWGKIVGLGYTIKNGYSGTLKLDHLMMTMEGYDDFFKEIPLPDESLEIKAGVVHKGSVSIDPGFAYNEATAGELDSVRVTVILYDQEGKVVTSWSKEIDIGKEIN